MKLLENDILILVLILSFLFSLIKVIKIKHHLWLIGFTILLLIPIIFGYDYRYLLIRDILYLILIFLIFGIIFKLIIKSNLKYLKGATILFILLLGINSFKDGVSCYYKVDVYPEILENKYLVSYNGLRVITPSINEYRYRSMPVIHKFYFNRILRKQLKSQIISTTSEYTFEHRLEDGGIILYKDGIFSLIKDGDNLDKN